jgi:hypothetical protein
MLGLNLHIQLKYCVDFLCLPSHPPCFTIVLHAYGAGNEPYDIWSDLDRKSQEYKDLKEERAQALWRAIEAIIPDVQERVVLSQIGSPITHERFLRRPRGTYGAATEDYLKDGSTPFERLVLCGKMIQYSILYDPICFFLYITKLGS